MSIRIHGISTDEHERFRRGDLDANGQPPLITRAEGPANPCRHCLALIDPGDDMLILAYRPFSGLHPYAEIGPIFLHAGRCSRYDAGAPPAWFDYLEPALIRGYDANDWIRYDTAHVVPGVNIAASCDVILHDSSVAYVHVRSKYNCFQCRVERR